MQHRSLSNTRWMRRPPVSITAIGIGVGLAVFAVYAIVIRSVVGPDALDRPGWKVALHLLGFALAGGALSATRALASSGASLVVACEDAGLRVGDRFLPYATIRRVSYAHETATSDVRAGSSTPTTDAVLRIETDGAKFRLLAVDTVVDDFGPALARIERENGSAIVGPEIPRS